MPTYRVTDPSSGRTIRITGDKPPSEAELNEIFSKASGISNSQPTPETQPTGNLKYQQGDNPLLYAAAKGQEFLNKSSTLPIVGGIIGRATTKSPAGSGIGTGTGVLLQRQLSPENAGVVEPKVSDFLGLNNPLSQGITPLNKPLRASDYVDAAKAGGAAAAIDFTLTKIVPAILRPSKKVISARNMFIEKNGEKMISGDEVAKAVTEKFNKIPAAKKTKVVVKAYEATMKELQGKSFPLREAVNMKMEYFKPSFSTTTGNPLKGTPIDAILKSAGQGMRGQIRNASQGVAAADDIFAALARAKGLARLPLKIGAGAAIGTGVGTAISKVLGR